MRIFLIVALYSFADVYLYFSGFVLLKERIQSDQSDCRHCIEGMSVTKPGSKSFFYDMYLVGK